MVSNPPVQDKNNGRAVGGGMAQKHSLVRFACKTEPAQI